MNLGIKQGLTVGHMINYGYMRGNYLQIAPPRFVKVEFETRSAAEAPLFRANHYT